MAAAALAASATLAQAQDSFDWAGGYVGIFADTGSMNIGASDEENLLSTPFVASDIDADSLFLGGLAGFNWQRNNVVYGIQLDAAKDGPSGSSAVDTINLDETLEWSTKSLVTLRGRVGIAKDRTLFFGTAGIARAKANYGFLNLDDSFTIVQSDNRETSTFDGIVVGLGVEQAVTEKATLRAELLHSRFESKTLDLFTASTPIKYTPKSTSIRASLVYNF